MFYHFPDYGLLLIIKLHLQEQKIIKFKPVTCFDNFKLTNN